MLEIEVQQKARKVAMKAKMADRIGHKKGFNASSVKTAILP